MTKATNESNMGFLGLFAAKSVTDKWVDSDGEMFLQLKCYVVI